MPSSNNFDNVYMKFIYVDFDNRKDHGERGRKKQLQHEQAYGVVLPSGHTILDTEAIKPGYNSLQQLEMTLSELGEYTIDCLDCSFPALSKDTKQILALILRDAVNKRGKLYEMAAKIWPDDVDLDGRVFPVDQEVESVMTWLERGEDDE